MHELADRYRAEHFPPLGQQQQQHGGGGARGGGSLKVCYSAKRGFYLNITTAAGAGGGGGGRGGGRGRGGRFGRGGAGWLPPPPAAQSQADLPRVFLRLESRGCGSSTLATTHELNALNARLKDAASDCMILTQQVLEELTCELCRHMPALLQLLDNLALLDMLLAFAEAGSRTAASKPT